MNQIQYGAMIIIGLSIFGLNYLAFGHGHNSMAFFSLPGVIFLIVGLCGIGRVFELNYKETIQE